MAETIKYSLKYLFSVAEYIRMFIFTGVHVNEQFWDKFISIICNTPVIDSHIHCRSIN